MAGVIYTFYGKHYQKTLCAHADTLLEIGWVADKGLPSEASGSNTVRAYQAQSTIWGLESQGYEIESINFS